MPDNFKAMLKAFEFPYVFQENKTLGQNRCDFKDFFSYLTNIRCAVVEGSHRCEAACRVLHGYMLGDTIPLESHPLPLPDTSKLFKTILTTVYFGRDEKMELNQPLLKHFRELSEKLAKQKELVVKQSWHYFFTNVLQEMSNKRELSQVLYETQAVFFCRMYKLQKYQQFKYQVKPNQDLHT